jgi:RNA polymerase sigma-70 factor (ECF subfamily)
MSGQEKERFSSLFGGRYNAAAVVPRFDFLKGGRFAMSASDSFTDIMARLRGGDQGAAREIFQRFVDQLVRLAHRQFDAVMRRKVDAEDVVQSAYKSFFLRYGDGKMEIQNWGNLWGMLTVITLRKCFDRVEYHRAALRDVRREASAQSDTTESLPWWEAVARDPTPEEAAMLAETVEQLLRGLEIDERPVLEMSLQGYSSSEISQQTGVGERTVRRMRERIRKKLERMQLVDG